MRQARQFCAIMLLGFWALASLSPLFAQNADLENSLILYKYEGKSMKDSQWGKITEFQQALSAHLRDCGKPGLGADGTWGNGTQKGLQNLLSCSGFADLAVSPDHPLHGALHTALWKRLLPERPAPTVHERAFALSLTHEATDYDRVEWNYGTDDDKSALTWGPYGATVGWGNEVRAVLKRLHENQGDLLKNTFGEEYAIVEKLITSEAKSGYALMKEVHNDPTQRDQFKKKLQALGATAEARAAYDWYAFEGGQWLKPNLKRLYSLIPEAAATATEIDYALFLDLGMHAGVGQDRIDKVSKAITAKEQELGRPLSPAERRQAIGEAFVAAINPRWREDRRGRNVVFYVDGIERTNLSEAEISAWNKRSGRKASNFGLSDSRKYYPAFLK